MGSWVLLRREHSPLGKASSSGAVAPASGVFPGADVLLRGKRSPLGWLLSPGEGALLRGRHLPPGRLHLRRASFPGADVLLRGGRSPLGKALSSGVVAPAPGAFPWGGCARRSPLGKALSPGVCVFPWGGCSCNARCGIVAFWDSAYRIAHSASLGWDRLAVFSDKAFVNRVRLCLSVSACSPRFAFHGLIQETYQKSGQRLFAGRLATFAIATSI